MHQRGGGTGVRVSISTHVGQAHGPYNSEQSAGSLGGRLAADGTVRTLLYDGDSRRRAAGAPSNIMRCVLAPVRGRDFCEDGVGNDEESCMSSHSSEYSFVRDNFGRS